MLECSLCSKVLKSQPGLSRDVILQRHVASGCMEGLRKARPNKLRCAAPGCRGSEFVKVNTKVVQAYVSSSCFSRQDLWKCDQAGFHYLGLTPRTSRPVECFTFHRVVYSIFVGREEVVSYRRTYRYELFNCIPSKSRHPADIPARWPLLDKKRKNLKYIDFRM